MSYCQECHGRNYHVPGCPDDEGYDDENEEVYDGYYDEDPPSEDLDYDVEWVPGKGLTIVR